MDNTTTSTSYTINPPRQYGWVCPLCGRANAPWVSQCSCIPIKPVWSSSKWTNTPDYTITID